MTKDWFDKKKIEDYRKQSLEKINKLENMIKQIDEMIVKLSSRSEINENSSKRK
ncbi:hypothetical protein [Thomasclavelia sp.]|uniref:hypothetical protein n=1 Tax=Thomasclavelia sp. TaxID=3025757 RepID=UPI0025DBD97E|nr:hypothetical protein [Thomasclavelia sp.]